MQIRPNQFSIYSLFFVTSVSAVALALFRLPIPLVARMLMVQSVAVCAFGLLIRSGGQLSPRVRSAALVVLAAPFVVRAGWDFIQALSRGRSATALVEGSVALAVTALLVIQVASVLWYSRGRKPAGSDSG